MLEKLEVFEKKYEEISQRICDPAVAASAEKYTAAMKELRQIEPVALKYREYKDCITQLGDAKTMLGEESDQELKTLVENEIRELESCYQSCLELADEHELKSIAFCSISTGVFNFPKDQASKLAIETVRNYLKNNPNTNIEKIILNTFSDEATEIYRKNLK